MTSTIVKFKLRRDTSINWQQSQIPLQDGEPGFDTTNNVLKIGPVGGALWDNIPKLSANIPIATIGSLGGIIPDGSTITVNSQGVISTAPIPPPFIPTASYSTLGVVRPDQNTITITSGGVISAQPPAVPIATTSTLGTVKPDGTTISINTSGTIATIIRSTLFLINPAGQSQSRFTIPLGGDIAKITGVNTVNFNTSAIVGSGGTIRIDINNFNLIKVTCSLTFDGRDNNNQPITGGFNRGYLYWQSNDYVATGTTTPAYRSVDIANWVSGVSNSLRYPVTYTWTLQKGIDFTSSSQYVELWAQGTNSYTMEFFFNNPVASSSDRLLVEYIS